VPLQTVALWQKKIVADCNDAGKPVIVATQMLESMTSNPRPTRAEVSDVANAILDGADCVMLSGETAKGKYPKEAVSTMSATALEAEAAIFYKTLAADLRVSLPTPMDPNESVAKAVCDAATSNGAALIITLTTTGTSARLISKFRPRCPILVLAQDEHVGAACNLHRGCVPYLYPRPDEPFDKDTRFAYGLDLAKGVGMIKAGDNVVLAHGSKQGANAAGGGSLTNFLMATAA